MTIDKKVLTMGHVKVLIVATVFALGLLFAPSADAEKKSSSGSGGGGSSKSSGKGGGDSGGLLGKVPGLSNVLGAFGLGGNQQSGQQSGKTGGKGK